MASFTADFSMVGVAGRRLRLGQWHVGAQGARPLVLLGGIGMNMELLEPVVRALPCRRIISFDMPGIGKSPDPIIPYTMPCIALTLAALLDRLHLDAVDVLGISWGGAVAQQFAFQHRARIGRLALAATAAGAAMVPGNPAIMSHMADPREYTVARTLQRNLASLYNGGGHQAVSLNAAMPPSPVGWACQLAAFSTWSSAPFLPLLALPTLVMHDEEDQLIPPANAQFLHGAIPGSRLEMFKGGGHLFMLADPEAFAATLRGFLDAA
ncbi:MULTISPECIES: alpha/beta fold hydrolase [unclassified Novosphingobium]|uniref:alpha/beta fold hydrolase n=1 Tax=unclassified Novosphingobium TaxID=2644732 RepID=UPI000D4C339C|nr:MULTISPECIES: alpha/beta fold hydrolase [unclassified Novosphingobium]PTR11099.1 pimeloyl-ACP methyl ester carboxylesterase [Novosphingobium sp. GV055]PUB03649.1 pimeloyl-ACP methyl ester carboxylesterase [Novosphingobium sp. GV061]PUB20104.1 pimeloyl-ACP methyl ester carboxylesterase [Novosphingobium sp. GV079]PUB41865.1 pimeloyl-ACP methyl ester carboxylesterase [Novosphingobium sp. GV027]